MKQKVVFKKSDEKSNVVVYDAIMGSGKTHEAIERMKIYIKKEKKFIYITPFLNEINRVINSLPIESVFTPLGREDNNGKSVYDYELINESGEIDLNANNLKYLNKRTQFLKFVAQGKNIISTHALFMDLKKEDFSLFKDYILILDEVVTPLKTTKIGSKDIEILRNEELVIIDEDTNEVRFIDDDYKDNAFKNVKSLCNNSTVFYLDKYFFVWIFPIEIFKEFKETQILTYLFEGSLLSAYFKMYKIKYNIISKESHKERIALNNLLNIYEGQANQIVGLNTNFSKTWIENLSKAKARQISNSTSNLFKRGFKTKSNENAFTTFKDFKSKFAGKGYTTGFISINARATNDFNHKKSMAYLGNRYFDPQTISFFRQKGVELNEDLWALSELIQWVWRGCIRDHKPMNLFIPSMRMRGLLKNWMTTELIDSNILLEGNTELKKIA